MGFEPANAIGVTGRTGGGRGIMGKRHQHKHQNGQHPAKPDLRKHMINRPFVPLCDLEKEGLPETIRFMLGRKVIRAWGPQVIDSLIVHLEGDHLMMIEPVKSPYPEYPVALSFHVGGFNGPVAQISAEFDQQIGANPYTTELRGTRFNGLDGNVVKFGMYGAMFDGDGRVHWMRKAN